MVLWRWGSTRRAIQAGVSVSAGERVNNDSVTQAMWKSHIDTDVNMITTLTGNIFGSEPTLCCCRIPHHITW